jgi:hypothetical protein
VDWIRHLCVKLRSHFPSFCTLCTCVLHLSERYGALCTTSMAFAPVDLVQLFLPQRQFQKLTCNKFDHWIFGVPVAGVIPVAGLETSHILRAAYARGVRFVTIADPNQFSYQTLGQLSLLSGHTHFAFTLQPCMFIPDMTKMWK